MYALLGLVLWPIPLLNVLHAESAAMVAFVAFFVAGWAALTALNRPVPPPVGHVLAIQGAALLVPLALLTISLLWAPNCDYGRGLLFYGGFPGITVVFAVAMAYALSGTGWRFQHVMLTIVGLGIAVLGPLYDLGFHPQFYTYNHVFGGVLGPIYDEELAVRPGLFAFRGLTLLWALSLFLMGRWLRATTAARVASPARWACGAGMGGLLVLIALGYAFSASLGINTTAAQLQQQLGGHYRTTHFDIYYDPEALDAHEVKTLAREHVYRYAWLEEQLQMEGPERVTSYLYPDSDTKARLTGARTTSIAPVWLSTPQMHMLHERFEATFGHELVHVFSRTFGMPVLNASWAVGLVEGLAVALEPPDGRPTPAEQVSAAALQSGTSSDLLAEQVASRLQPLGFWTGRGAVSYTTMGAFVQFLKDRYGSERLRAVYARANFEAVYGRSLEALAQEWAAALHERSLIARDAAALVTQRFAQPSLFEQPCPHYVPPPRRAYRDGEAALAAGDTTAAADRFRAALHDRPQYADAHRALAQIRLAQGRAKAVIQQLDTLATTRRTPALAFSLGDAYVMSREPDAARRMYQVVLQRIPHYAHATRAHVVLRRAVADRPDVVRILTAGATADQKARRLRMRSHASPAVGAWEARQWMVAGRYDRAAARWAALPHPLLPDERRAAREVVERERLRWHATSALEQGDEATAIMQAHRAAAAFRAVGAVNVARATEDLRQQAEWIQRQGAAAPR